MSLKLCIDGGGTKTRAVIVQKHNGQYHYASGEAGPSNLTFGVDNCIQATRTAVLAAITELSLDATALSSISHIWAGYAGCARRSDYEALFPPLQALFPKAKLRLTSDAELLTAPLIASPCNQCITLICGTGSLALKWSKQGDGVEQMGRNGGWGSLLGDEGSGWSLGREAIKSVLSYAANKRDLLPWHLSILDRFELDNPDRLITAVSQLDTNLSHGLADSGRKKRIASCAKVAVKAAEKGDVEATRIVVKVAEEIIGTIRPLVDRPGVTLLVVTGGLAGAEVFWKEVERGMKHMGWNWAEVIKVDDPAMEGLQSIQDAFT